MDGIGKIGFSFLKGTSHKIAMGFTIALSALSFILYIVGCAGWNTSSSLQSSSWATTTISGSGSVYFGLRSSFVVANTGTSSQGTDYSTCTSSSSVCSSCLSSGDFRYFCVFYSLVRG